MSYVPNSKAASNFDRGAHRHSHPTHPPSPSLQLSQLDPPVYATTFAPAMSSSGHNVKAVLLTSPSTAAFFFVLQAPLGFDMSLTQMALTMMTGGTMVLASARTRKDPVLLADLMLAERITHTFMTPTLAMTLIHYLRLRDSEAM